MAEQLTAFVSYTRADDDGDDHYLTKWCRRLETEYYRQSGRPLRVLQDLRDIPVVAKWRRRIDEMLAEADILIAFVSPLFFESEHCRWEVMRFTELKQPSVHILPVYYIETQWLEASPPAADAAGEERRRIAHLLAAHQIRDWRSLRFTSLNTKRVKLQIAEIAAGLDDLRSRLQHQEPTSEAVPEATGPPPAPPAPPPPAVVRPQPIVVAQDGSGAFRSIGEALRKAPSDAPIVVRPGVYHESLVVDRAVVVRGEGEPGEVVVESSDASVLRFEAGTASISNLTFRQLKGANLWYAVDIAAGRLDLEDCDISSDGLACVAIHGGADPCIRRCRVHDGHRSGIHVFDSGRGTIENCEIFCCERSGVDVKAGGASVLRSCRIHDHKQGGVYIYEDAGGTIEDCEIYANALDGVAVTQRSAPSLLRCRVHHNRRSGVLFFEEARGLLDGCEIFDNTEDGIVIRSRSEPTITDCVVKGNRRGVRVTEAGGGLVRGCTLSGNTVSAWYLSADSQERLRREGNEPNE